MKLLICTQSVDPNDHIAGFFFTWVEEFAKHVDEVLVIALSGVGGEALPKNVRVISLGKEFAGKGRSLRRSEATGKGVTLKEQAGALVVRMKYILRFYSIILRERNNYDTVFVHNVGPKFIILGAPVWKLLHKRIALWYVHKSVDWKLRIAEKFTGIIFSSAPESFRLPSKKVHFLGHGIDTTALGKVSRHPDTQVFTILQVGRITPIKHCEVLIRAVSIFATKYPHSFKVLFVGTPLAQGDDEYFTELNNLVSTLQLDDHVTFLGGVAPERLRDYYATAHVTINMLPTGGMDKVVLESAATGVPFFTSNQVFREMFGVLSSRFVLPELNAESPRQLASALVELVAQGMTEQEHHLLKESVQRTASLPVLIGRIIELLYGKTS